MLNKIMNGADAAISVGLKLISLAIVLQVVFSEVPFLGGGNVIGTLISLVGQLGDAGLVGLPNAGKSTFINAVTNANAKVGAYPFTTTRPQLGVASRHGREFVIADIPGLIEGAADGAGIGDRFLGHIERCRVLLHLVDASGDDPVAAYKVVRNELDKYGADLVGKPEVIGLNKIDAVDPAEVKKLATKLKRASKAEVLLLSGASGDGVDAVLDRLLEAIGPVSPMEAPKTGEDSGWSPI